MDKFWFIEQFEHAEPKAPLCKGGSREAGGGLSLPFILQSLRPPAASTSLCTREALRYAVEQINLTDKSTIYRIMLLR